MEVAQLSLGGATKWAIYGMVVFLIARFVCTFLMRYFSPGKLLFFFALLAMIIISWVVPGSGHPAVFLLYQITEPVMAPFRKVLPAAGGIDFSPILVFILINVVQIALRHMAGSVGLHSALVIGL